MKRLKEKIAVITGAEILKGTMDIKGMQRSLEGATKQLLVSVDEDVIHIRCSQENK